eukprot:489081-Rhodomonas_salina.1
MKAQPGSGRYWLSPGNMTASGGRVCCVQDTEICNADVCSCSTAEAGSGLLNKDNRVGTGGGGVALLVELTKTTGNGFCIQILSRGRARFVSDKAGIAGCTNDGDEGPVDDRRQSDLDFVKGSDSSESESEVRLSESQDRQRL